MDLNALHMFVYGYWFGLSDPSSKEKVSVGSWASVRERWFVSVGLWLLRSPLGQRNQTEESIEHSESKKREECRATSDKGQIRVLSVQRLQTEKSLERSKSCVERSVIRRVLSPALSAPFSIERSVLRQPFRPASSALSSVERSVLRRAPRPPLSVPSCEERSVLRQEFRPRLSVPPCEERSVLCWWICPPSTNLVSKSVDIPVPSKRVLHPLRDSGQKSTSAGQRRAARTNWVLRRAFRALRPATAYHSVTAITGRDTPAPGRSDQPKPQGKSQRKLQGFCKGKTSKWREIETY